MLIDKRQPFWTELEIEKDLEYKQEYDKLALEAIERRYNAYISK